MWRPVPIIMITAYGDEDEIKALETSLGAAYHTNRLWNASSVGIDVGVERAA